MGWGADSRQLPGLISVSGRQGSRLRDWKRVIRSRGRGFERRAAAPQLQLQPAYASNGLGRGRSGPFEASLREVGTARQSSARSSFVHREAGGPVSDSFSPLPKDLQIDKVNFGVVMLTLPCEQAGGNGALRLLTVFQFTQGHFSVEHLTGSAISSPSHKT